MRKQFCKKQVLTLCTIITLKALDRLVQTISKNQRKQDPQGAKTTGNTRKHDQGNLQGGTESAAGSIVLAMGD